MEYKFANRDDEDFERQSDCVYVTRSFVKNDGSRASKLNKGLEGLLVLLKRAGRFSENIHEDTEAKAEWLVAVSPKKFGSGGVQDLKAKGYNDAQIGNLFNKTYDWLETKTSKREY